MPRRAKTKRRDGFYIRPGCLQRRELFERSASGAGHHIYYFLFILYYLKKQVLT